MLNTKKLFGYADIEKSEIENTSNEKINLKYYKTKTIISKSNTKKYGIEIVKELECGNNKSKEKSKVNNITDNELLIEKILDIFIRNKVTPISIEEILADLKKVYDY